jgi:type II secretory pathway pseudopilin PulG
MKAVSKEAGFSYIDVMIAVTILLVGVMGLAGAITRGIALTTVSQEMLTAKQMAASTVEAIFTARELELNGFGWPSIGNVGSSSVPAGIFLTGEQLIYPTPGADGIVGTADDSKGPDGIAGNADDGTPTAGFTRQITITDIADPNRPNAPITLRQMDVTINFWTSGKKRRETFTTYIAFYRTNDD